MAGLFPRTAPDARDSVATLLAAAREDPVLRRQLVALLQTPARQRASILNTALHEMKLRGEPESVRAAFALLIDDAGASAALQALENS